MTSWPVGRGRYTDQRDAGPYLRGSRDAGPYLADAEAVAVGVESQGGFGAIRTLDLEVDLDGAGRPTHGEGAEGLRIAVLAEEALGFRSIEEGDVLTEGGTSVGLTDGELAGVGEGLIKLGPGDDLLRGEAIRRARCFRRGRGLTANEGEQGQERTPELHGTEIVRQERGRQPKR